MRKPLGVIFDYGDTILHLESLDTVAGNRRLLELAEVNPGVTIEDVQAAVKEIGTWVDHAKDMSMIEVNCRSYNRLLYEPLGVTFDISEADLEREFWQASFKHTPVAGISKLMDALDVNGVKTGILSNTIFSSTMLKEELVIHNLADRFPFIVTSADYGLRKPHRYIFQVAVKKMGLDPSDIWFVGDTPQHDVRGALDSGLFPVWLNWRKEPRRIDGDYLEVKTLDELTKKIEGLYRR